MYLFIKIFVEAFEAFCAISREISGNDKVSSLMDYKFVNYLVEKLPHANIRAVRLSNISERSLGVV